MHEPVIGIGFRGLEINLLGRGIDGCRLDGPRVIDENSETGLVRPLHETGGERLLLRIPCPEAAANQKNCRVV